LKRVQADQVAWYFFRPARPTFILRRLGLKVRGGKKKGLRRKVAERMERKERRRRRRTFLHVSTFPLDPDSEADNFRNLNSSFLSKDIPLVKFS